jgi:CO/xanthine dehydrogenase FAD-binding subunit
VKPPVFDYLAPASLDEALKTLADLGERAKVLAGGQSLVALLNFRLVRPEHLVDLNGVPELAGIREDDGHVVIGAMTRQRAVEQSTLVRQRVPLLSEAMPQIGHVQIRNRGTIGGSLAHADPAGELPAVVAALGGELVARSLRGRRVLKAGDFFMGYLTTALEADELLVEVRLPTTAPRTGSAFVEVSRRHGDFALVGVAATVTLDEGGVCTSSNLALTGVGPAPVLAGDAARGLVGARPTAKAMEDAGARVAAAIEPDSDLHASRDFRKHLAGVLTRRALVQAAERAGGGRTDSKGGAR